jgi:superfamily II DNA or RNA helicase
VHKLPLKSHRAFHDCLEADLEDVTDERYDEYSNFVCKQQNDVNVSASVKGLTISHRWVCPSCFFCSDQQSKAMMGKHKSKLTGEDCTGTSCPSRRSVQCLVSKARRLCVVDEDAYVVSAQDDGSISDVSLKELLTDMEDRNLKSIMGGSGTLDAVHSPAMLRLIGNHKLTDAALIAMFNMIEDKDNAELVEIIRLHCNKLLYDFQKTIRHVDAGLLRAMSNEIGDSTSVADNFGMHEDSGGEKRAAKFIVELRRDATINSYALVMADMICLGALCLTQTGALHKSSVEQMIDPITYADEWCALRAIVHEPSQTTIKALMVLLFDYCLSVGEDTSTCTFPVIAYVQMRSRYTSLSNLSRSVPEYNDEEDDDEEEQVDGAHQEHHTAVQQQQQQEPLDVQVAHPRSIDRAAAAAQQQQQKVSKGVVVVEDSGGYMDSYGEVYCNPPRTDVNTQQAQSVYGGRVLSSSDGLFFVEDVVQGHLNQQQQQRVVGYYDDDDDEEEGEEVNSNSTTVQQHDGCDTGDTCTQQLWGGRNGSDIVMNSSSSSSGHARNDSSSSNAAVAAAAAHGAMAGTEIDSSLAAAAASATAAAVSAAAAHGAMAGTEIDLSSSNASSAAAVAAASSAVAAASVAAAAHGAMAGTKIDSSSAAAASAAASARAAAVSAAAAHCAMAGTEIDSSKKRSVMDTNVNPKAEEHNKRQKPDSTSTEEQDNGKFQDVGNVPLFCDSMTHSLSVFKHIGKALLLSIQIERWSSRTGGGRVIGGGVGALAKLGTYSFDLDLARVLSRSQRTVFRAIYSLANLAYKMYARVSNRHRVTVMDPLEGELPASRLQVGSEIINLSDVRFTIQNMYEHMCSELEQCLGPNVKRELFDSKSHTRLVDDMSDLRPGHSLGKDMYFHNLFVLGFKFLGSNVTGGRLTYDAEKGRCVFAIDSEKSAIALREWLVKATQLVRVCGTFVHLCCPPGRGTEAVTARTSNGVTTLRSVYLVDGRIMLNVGYHKQYTGLNSSGLSSVCRHMPRFASGVLLGLMFVLPRCIQVVAEALVVCGVGDEKAPAVIRMLGFGHAYLYEDSPAGADRYRTDFKMVVHAYSHGRIANMGVAAYRQFAATVVRCNVDPTRRGLGIHAIASTLALNHTVGTAAMSYGTDSGNSIGQGGPTAEQGRAWVLASNIHHVIVGMSDIGFLPDPLDIPTPIRRLLHVGARERSGALVEDNEQQQQQQQQQQGLASCSGADRNTKMLFELQQTVSALSKQVVKVFSRVTQVLSLQSCLVNGHATIDSPIAIEESSTMVPVHLLSSDHAERYLNNAGLALGLDDFKFRSPEQALCCTLVCASIEIGKSAYHSIGVVIYVSGTGSGKSLVALAGVHFASWMNSTGLYARRCVVLIVPYRALLQQLLDLAIKACVNGSDGAKVWSNDTDGNGISGSGTAVVLISLEVLCASKQAQSWIEQHASTVVFDESHVLLSECDFRRSVMKSRPILAGLQCPVFFLSATVARGTAKGLCEVLGKSFSDPTRFGVSLIRSPRTVNRSVLMYTERFDTKEVMFERVLELGRENLVDFPLMFFCSTVDMVERTYSVLKRALDPHGLEKVRFYHGQLGNDDKDAVYRAMKDGSVRALVCTRAFGIGLDIKHITKAWFVGPPVDLVGLVQMAGRVGRDEGVTGRVGLLLWNGCAREMTKMFNLSGDAVAEMQVMCREDRCLPAVLSHKFDGVDGLLCSMSDDYTTCGACLEREERSRVGGSSSGLGGGMGLKLGPKSGTEGAFQVVQGHQRLYEYNDMGLSRARNSFAALQCAEQFGKRTEWAMGISYCFECFHSHAFSGRDVACPLQGPPYVHANRCFECILGNCAKSGCPVNPMRRVKSVETCWTCRAPCDCGGLRTHTPQSMSHIGKRAMQYAQTERLKSCASGLQDWFGGLVFQGASLWLRNNEKQGSLSEIKLLVEHSLTLSNTNELGLFGLCNQYLQFAQELVRRRGAALG